MLFQECFSSKVIYRHTQRDSKKLINTLKELKNLLYRECFRHFSE